MWSIPFIRAARQARPPQPGRAVRRIDGVLVCGTGDPAETGQLYGALVPLMVLSNGRFQMHPEFDRPVLAARLDLEISAIPVALLPACLRLVRARRGAA